jgi:hypothetical protein
MGKLKDGTAVIAYDARNGTPSVDTVPTKLRAILKTDLGLLGLRGVSANVGAGLVPVQSWVATRAAPTNGLTSEFLLIQIFVIRPTFWG